MLNKIKMLCLTVDAVIHLIYSQVRSKNSPAGTEGNGESSRTGQRTDHMRSGEVLANLQAVYQCL